MREIKTMWDVSNELEQVSYRLESIMNVVEILAEREFSNAESGALWAVAEMLEVYADKLSSFSAEAMNVHRETLPGSKAKKKKAGGK